MTTKTRSLAIAEDISALLRARNPLIWIVTREEARVEEYLASAASSAKFAPHAWDVAQGLMNLDGTVSDDFDGTEDARDAMRVIATRATNGRPVVDERIKNRDVWIMRDLPSWLSGPSAAATLRALRNLVRLIPSVPSDQSQSLIVLSPSGDVPPELTNHTTVIEWPLPDRDEIGGIIDSMIERYDLGETMRNGAREAAIDAAVGLSGEESESCFAKSLVQLKKIDPIAVAQEKKRVITRERVLEWYDPLPGGLDAVGGLGNLKTWLMARSSAYSPAARAYGLPMPRGAMFVGISGCGKTLLAKATATAWQCPLIKLDLGALKSKFVGDSEANLRKALRVIEAIGRCVVWIDEVEKALQGATSGSSDGGVSSDALGAILTWMQERQGGAFIIATSNDVTQLPPEFLRKGRFDEIFWVDLPNEEERIEVLAAALRAHGRDLPRDGAFADVVAACRDFTGAEIAAIVPDALFASFADGARDLAATDLLAAAKSVVPLVKTAEKKIKDMRDWSTGKTRPASAPSAARAAPARAAGRSLDI